VVKLEQQLDYPSYFDENVNRLLHIHVFHGDDMFSKFQFKAGKYNSMSLPVTSGDEAKPEETTKATATTVTTANATITTTTTMNMDASLAKFYALKMALEGNRIPGAQLVQLLNQLAAYKT